MAGNGAAPAVEVSHLSKSYGELRAADDVSFSISVGEIFGLLGPNGAGKTTTVECLIGLRKADSGTVRLLGLDSVRDLPALHQLVGVQLQESALPGKLRVGEIVELYRSFYRTPAQPGELLEALGLGQQLRTYYRSLSGGQKQRLSLLLALIGSPRLAVLDEMTTGLDPEARRSVWQLIDEIRGRGTTVLLVTHFMDEAQHLCDRVAFMQRGRIAALDSPATLASHVTGGKRVSFVPSDPFDDSLLTDLDEVSALERHEGRVLVTGKGDLVNAVILTLDRHAVAARDVTMEGASLEDAFLELAEETVAT